MAETVLEGLEKPTQMIPGPNGQLWVAQLGTGGGHARGSVLAIDLDSGDRRVVVDGLDKPTGIAIVSGYLWIATERDLMRAPIDESGNAGEAAIVLERLPYDGRSNGTLTLTPTRELLYETSGVRFGGKPLADSATLWQLDPVEPEQPCPLATGVRGAYAHTFHGEDGLWFTEIGGDRVNGHPPPDELNFLRLRSDCPAVDYGWPKCYGQREPAVNYGGDASHCLETQPSALLFPPDSMPTSIVLSPWEDDTLLVALRGEGAVAKVEVDYIGDGAVAQAELFVDGLRSPQHLLVWNRNTLLISDHKRGDIIAVYHAADG